MKFQKLFYDASVDFKKLTTKRVVFGIALGIISTFTIYSFFYIISEAYKKEQIVLKHKYPVIIIDKNEQ